MKDNNNKLDINLWSGGEYDNSLTNVWCNQDNQKCIISDEWSYIGESSFKITRGGGIRGNWMKFMYRTATAKQTLTCTCKIYSPSAEALIWLCDDNQGNEGSHTSVRIYPSNNVQTITLTYTGTLTTITSYCLRVNMEYDNTVLFIDDIIMSSS